MATPLLLPRGTLPADFGDRLRAAGLNQGVSFGGSEIDVPEGLTPEQQAQFLTLASGGGGPTISNADLARFLAMQNGGNLPGLPNAGGDDNAPPAMDMPEGPTGAPAAPGEVGADTVGNPTGEAANSAAQASSIGATIGGFGGSLMGGLAGGAVPGAGFALGPLGALIGGPAGRNIGEAAAQRLTNQTPVPPFGFPVAEGNREDIAGLTGDPNADAAANAATAAATTEGVAGGTSSGGVSGSTGSEGGSSGTGGGPGGDSSDGGGSGAPGDGPYRRGGVVKPMTRAQRVKSFESKFGNRAV